MSIKHASTQTTDHEEIGVITAIALETRKTLFLRQHKIAGTMVLSAGGPTRILFDAGGYVDVCGPAEQWSSMIEIARIEESARAK